MTVEEQKKIFITVAIAIFASGMPLIDMGFILGDMQRIHKESLRETLNIIVLIASISYVSIIHIDRKWQKD